jgi:hypothetical protein
MWRPLYFLIEFSQDAAAKDLALKVSRIKASSGNGFPTDESIRQTPIISAFPPQQKNFKLIFVMASYDAV